jgi:hypothetical protein
MGSILELVGNISIENIPPVNLEEFYHMTA